MTISNQSINQKALGKGGISLLSPEEKWKQFKALEDLLNNMYQVRSAVGSDCPSHSGSGYSGPRDLRNIDDDLNGLIPCSCDARQQTVCDCVSRTMTPTCNCDVRTVVCDCQARTLIAACNCEGRTGCSCNARTVCNCNARSGPCDCESRVADGTCDCHYRCGSAEPWASGRYWTCVCFSRGTVCDCHYRTDSCDCNSRTACDCNARIGCDCVSRTLTPACNCNARTAFCDCVTRTYIDYCTCEGRCSCDTVKEFYE